MCIAAPFLMRKSNAMPKVQQKKNTIATVNFPRRTVEGKRKGSGEGAGGAREKLLGPDMVFPRPSCNAFEFEFHLAPNRFPKPIVTKDS